MGPEKYSLEGFREAKDADLSPEDRVFLKNYKRLHPDNYPGITPEEWSTFHMEVYRGVREIRGGIDKLRDLIDPTTREFFGAKARKRFIDLTAKREKKGAGQLDAAHDEAAILNEEYDRLSRVIESRREDVETALKNLESFSAELNKK